MKSFAVYHARDDLVVALRRRTPVDRNAHDRDRVSFRRSFFNTHACFRQLLFVRAGHKKGESVTAFLSRSHPWERNQPSYRS